MVTDRTFIHSLYNPYSIFFMMVVYIYTHIFRYVLYMYIHIMICIYHIFQCICKDMYIQMKIRPHVHKLIYIYTKTCKTMFCKPPHCPSAVVIPGSSDARGARGVRADGLEVKLLPQKGLHRGGRSCVYIYISIPVYIYKYVYIHISTFVSMSISSSISISCIYIYVWQVFGTACMVLECCGLQQTAIWSL